MFQPLVLLSKRDYEKAGARYVRYVRVHNLKLVSIVTASQYNCLSIDRDGQKRDVLSATRVRQFF